MSNRQAFSVFQRELQLAFIGQEIAIDASGDENWTVRVDVGGANGLYEAANAALHDRDSASGGGDD